MRFIYEKKVFRACFFVTFLTIFPIWYIFYSGELLGYAGSEVWGHAWTHWWRGESFPHWPSGTDLVYGAKSWPAIDPLPTIISGGLGRLFGYAFGYNCWVTISIFLAACGGYQLARKMGGDPWIGAISLAWAPAFLGSIWSGLTEDMAIGLSALALSWLGTGTHGWKSGVGIGLTAFCGLVLGWMTGIAAFILGIAFILHDRSLWKRIFFSGLIASMIAFLAAWLHGDRLWGEGHRSGKIIREFEPLWQINPWENVDILSLVAPGRVDIAGEFVRVHPGYLGLSLLILACFAGRTRWWLVFIFFVMLSWGETFWMGGYPLNIENPFLWVVHWIPGGSLLNHHGRALLMAAIALSVLASKGIKKIPIRREIMWGMVLLDLTCLSPIPIFIPQTPPMDSKLTEIEHLSKGSVVVLPAGGPGVSFQRPLWEQHFHGRHVWVFPNRPGLPPSIRNIRELRAIESMDFDGLGEKISFSCDSKASILMIRTPLEKNLEKKLGRPDILGENFLAYDLKKHCL